MMTRLLFAVVLSAIGVAAEAAEPSFRFSKPVNLPELTQEELIAVPLDSDVFAATRVLLPDIRLLDEKGAEVAYVIRKAMTTKSETKRDYWAAREPAVKPLEDGGLEIVVHLGEKDAQPQGIRLVTLLHNFEQRIRVYSSADGKDWQPASDDAVIFDYTQFMDVRNDTIPIKSGNHRYFRVVVDKVTQELQSQLKEITRRLRGGEKTDRTETISVERRPFRIEHLEFWRDDVHEHVTGDLQVAYPVVGFHVENDAAKQQTVVHVESRREPLQDLTLVTPSRNFSRHARVVVEDPQGGEQHERMVGEATLSRLDFHNLKREDLKIGCSGSRETEYRLVIDNQNSPPLAVSGIQASGDCYNLYFMTGPSKAAYRLVYGNEDVEAPRYDAAAIYAALVADYKPAEATLGPQSQEPVGARPANLTISRLVNDPRVLGITAVVLVAALAWSLYRAGRRLNDLPPSDK